MKSPQALLPAAARDLKNNPSQKTALEKPVYIFYNGIDGVYPMPTGFPQQSMKLLFRVRKAPLEKGSCRLRRLRGFAVQGRITKNVGRIRKI